MKQKARLEIQQNSDDGTCRLQVWQDGVLLHTIDGIENVYPAMDHILGSLRADYIESCRKKSIKEVKPHLYIPGS